MNRFRLDPIRHIAVPASLVAVIAINIIAVTLPLGGRSTGELSALYQNLFTPAGYTFSIWSVIYLGLITFTLYQLLPSLSDNVRVQRIDILFCVTCFLNVAWLFAWHFQWLGISLVVMALLLATLAVMYTMLTGRKGRSTATHRLMVVLPIRVYFAWICVASLANLAAWFAARDWVGAGLSELQWALLMVAISAVLALLALATKRDIAFAAVIIWALIGVAVGQWGESSPVVMTAIGAATATLAAIVWLVMRRRQGGTTTPPAAV